MFLLSYRLGPGVSSNRYENLTNELRRRGAHPVLWAQWRLAGASWSRAVEMIKDLFSGEDRFLVTPYWGFHVLQGDSIAVGPSLLEVGSSIRWPLPPLTYVTSYARALQDAQ
jgi:hypothetical protein